MREVAESGTDRALFHCPNLGRSRRDSRYVDRLQFALKARLIALFSRLLPLYLASLARQLEFSLVLLESL